jgi:hypothetical protein
MDSTTATNWINIGIGLATLGAVIVAFLALRQSEKQNQKNWQQTLDLAGEERAHTRQLAQEERQLQYRPILIPTGYYSAHQPTGFIDWKQKTNVSIRNIGNGPALDVKAILWGTADGAAVSDHITYWRNNPFAEGEEHGLFPVTDGSEETTLGMETKIDGQHKLYNPGGTYSPPTYHIARLTITYRDILEQQKCYVSIFDYLLLPSGQHGWEQIKITATPEILKDLEELEYERMPNSKRRRPQE